MRSLKLYLFFLFFSKLIFCEDFNYLWAEYSTYFKDGIDARKKNIESAVKILDGYILYPNIEFSFIEEVINKIPEDEMGPASTIVGEKRVPGIGGGLCQVATTLYNLALLSGISIRERKNHSSPVSYVSPGLDATVSKEEDVDLKIQNPYKYPLMIKVKVINNKLQMELYGKVPKKRNIKIVVENFRKTDNYFETITKRYIYDEGKLLFYEIISKDKYKIDF
ncbi:MAG TPA: VanW family protein [bacterium]|nr:VanW family protein [bacterium]HOM26429.1 VanW family protein [bacterium]